MSVTKEKEVPPMVGEKRKKNGGGRQKKEKGSKSSTRTLKSVNQNRAEQNSAKKMKQNKENLTPANARTFWMASCYTKRK